MTYVPPIEAYYQVCLSTSRPAGPIEGQVIYEQDTNREWRYDGSAWVPSAVPRTKTASVTAAGGGTTSSTTAVALPTPLSLTFNKLYGTETNLIATVTGHLLIDDALSQASIWIDVGGSDTQIDRCDSIGANTVCTVAGQVDLGGLTAGSKTIAVQWSVSAGTVVATMQAYWSLRIDEIVVAS